ncbi:MAG: ribosome small subunit-dependent GTPase A [Aggregatilineales bacterium]
MSSKHNGFDSNQSGKNFDPNQFLKNQAKSELRRQEQKVIKKVKRNRKPDAPRHKHWRPKDVDDLDALDDLDLPARERIMPLGEQDRRKFVLARASQAIEDEQAADASAPELLDADMGTSADAEIEGVRGIVVEIGSSLCRVLIRRREYLCHVRGSLSMRDTAYTNVVAVGDQVIVSLTPSAESGVVERVLPRRSALTRPDPFNKHLRQVIASNVDQLLIIASWREPHLWPELIDRYLIAAARNNLTPLIGVNKIDLADDRAECETYMQPYIALGIPVLFVSAHTGEGIDGLRVALSGRSTVLAGLSGVGKSSLLVAVQPGLDLRTRDVNQHSGDGRHTTTQATLLPFGDGYVVDTPGIREFALNGVTRADLARFYPDLAAHAGECRFRDCVHLDETDCAVRAAVESGALPALRYETYCKIADTLKP